MKNKIQLLLKRIPIYIRQHGVFSFFHYILVSIILTITNFLLLPLKFNIAKDPFIHIFEQFLTDVNTMENPSVLEIGSRNVSGITRRNLFSENVLYTGFDLYNGDNVDITGDIHQLSDYISTETYDAVFSISVFEHLAMPWKALQEINKVLKPGGLLYISTHPVWPPHELPSDFWRYSKGSFHSLLNEFSGFEILVCKEGNPGRIISLTNDPSTNGVYLARINQSIAVIAKKTGDVDPSLSWPIPLTSIFESNYPKTHNS